uniref:Uncharacterized protein n=1 Tax=Anguilla anguilla TaxID=7936 RepID=A0A0E9TGG0_ANGAN
MLLSAQQVHVEGHVQSRYTYSRYGKVSSSSFIQ